jgi:hypothetical protein
MASWPCPEGDGAGGDDEETTGIRHFTEPTQAMR